MFSFMEFSSLVLVAVSIFGYLIYNLRKKYSYWANKGIPSLGFFEDVVLRIIAEHTNTVLKRHYFKLAPHPYGGIYFGAKPSLLIRDPELIQRICIKDFSHFTDRDISVVYEDVNPLSANILNIGGSRWRNLRAKLSPVFTSGKLKSMYGLLDECTNTLEKYLDRSLKKSKDLDAYEVMNKHTIDVIGTCAFGLDCSAIDDEQSEFRRIIGLVPSTPCRLFLREFLYVVCPSLIKLLNWKFMFPEVEKFFFSLTRETIKHREENVGRRNDYLQLLINARYDEQQMLLSEKSK